jgi:hypothetical protein
VKYEDSGIPKAVGDFLKKPGSEGYDERREKFIALLNEFGVPNAKVLPPEQYGAFLPRVRAL